MSFVTLDGMRMYYEEHGTPDSPPLVLLHGFIQTGAFWANQLAAFGAHYRLLVPDLRGHGRIVTEAWIGLHAHAHTEDFPEAEELWGIRAPVLIAHGDRDDLFPIEIPTSLYRLLPDAELCLLPNTKHAPPAEHPDWFNAITLDFLARRYVES